VEQIGDLVEIEPEPGSRFGLSEVDVVVESGGAPQVRARLASADLTLDREVTDLQVGSASGDVRAGRVSGSASVRMAAGDIRLESVGGLLSVSVGSGDVVVGEALGGADIMSASGDVRIATAGGGVKLKTASGDMLVGNLRSGDFEARSLSGDVVLGVPSGRVLDVSLDSTAGRVSTDFPVQSGAGDGSAGGVSLVKVRTLSGDVVLRPAENG
jgi:DUF4097 and DUF4098 domain-containing protein YvlB